MRAIVVSATLSAIGVAALAGCAAIDAPMLTSVFDEDPGTWKSLPRSQRYVRGWKHYERGVSYAKSAAIRSDHRLLGSGCERAAEGLAVCADAADPGDWQDGLSRLAVSFRALGNVARNGRLHRPRRRLDDLERESDGFNPRVVAFPDPDGATRSTPGVDERPTPPEGGPTTEIPEGTVFRKRTEIGAGAQGEVTTHILIVLKRGGSMVEVEVPEALWRRAVLGEAVPKPAGADTPPAKDGE